MSKGVGYGFGFAYFPSRFDQGNTLFIGTDGFMLRDMICKWSDFDRFEWDSDIGQKSWGVKFYKKNQKAYTKAYINRKHNKSRKEIKTSETLKRKKNKNWTQNRKTSCPSTHTLTSEAHSEYDADLEVLQREKFQEENTQANEQYCRTR